MLIFSWCETGFILIVRIWLELLEIVGKVNHAVNDVKKQYTKSTLPFLTKIESVTANAKRKVLKDGTRMDGIIKKTLSNTACTSKVLRGNPRDRRRRTKR